MMTSPSPTLAPLASIVQDLVDGERTVPETLARLRRGGYTVDVTALLEAKQAIDSRDLFLYRQGNPQAYLGHRVTAPLADVYELAVEKAEADYMTALLCMARPTRVRGVA